MPAPKPSVSVLDDSPDTEDVACFSEFPLDDPPFMGRDSACGRDIVAACGVAVAAGALLLWCGAGGLRLSTSISSS